MNDHTGAAIMLHSFAFGRWLPASRLIMAEDVKYAVCVRYDGHLIPMPLPTLSL